MYARVTSAQIEPKNIEQFKKIFAESVVPAAKEQKGFLAISLMINQETGAGLSIGYWESEEKRCQLVALPPKQQLHRS